MRYLAIVFLLLGLLEVMIKSWNYIIKKSMTCKISLDRQRVFVGEDVRMLTKITNDKIIPIPWIKVEIAVPMHFKFNNSKVETDSEGQNLFKMITSLLCFEQLERADSFKCNKRGVYKIRAAKINIGDFLGLQETMMGVPVKNELIVYPKIKELIDLIDISKSLQGNISVKRWIVNDYTHVNGARKYGSGDSFNTIHWKVSAKNNELYVKKFDFTSEPSIMLFLDVQTRPIGWMGNDYDLIEKGIEIIASIMDEALRNKIAVGYTANTLFPSDEGDIFIYPSSSRNQSNRILEALAKTTYTKTYSINTLTNLLINKLNKECTIILLLSYIPKELVKSLNHYSKCGYNIKIILLNNSCNTTGLSRMIEVIHSMKNGEVISHAQ